MRTDLYLSFIAYACATTFLPGPNNVLLLSQAGRYGIRKVRPLLFGIWCGLLTVMLIAGFFLNALGGAFKFRLGDDKVLGWINGRLVKLLGDFS